MMGRPQSAEIAGLIAGFGAWAMAFIMLYGGHGIACSAGSVPPAARAALVAAWLAMVAIEGLLAAWLWRRWRRAQPPVRFLRLVSLALAAGAVAATIWTGFPVAVLRLC